MSRGKPYDYRFSVTAAVITFFLAISNITWYLRREVLKHEIKQSKAMTGGVRVNWYDLTPFTSRLEKNCWISVSKCYTFVELRRHLGDEKNKQTKRGRRKGYLHGLLILWKGNPINSESRHLTIAPFNSRAGAGIHLIRSFSCLGFYTRQTQKLEVYITYATCPHSK